MPLDMEEQLSLEAHIVSPDFESAQLMKKPIYGAAAVAALRRAPAKPPARRQQQSQRGSRQQQQQQGKAVSVNTARGSARSSKVAAAQKLAKRKTPDSDEDSSSSSSSDDEDDPDTAASSESESDSEDGKSGKSVVGEWFGSGCCKEVTCCCSPALSGSCCSGLPRLDATDRPCRRVADGYLLQSKRLIPHLW